MCVFSTKDHICLFNAHEGFFFSKAITPNFPDTPYIGCNLTSNNLMTVHGRAEPELFPFYMIVYVSMHMPIVYSGWQRSY